MRPTTSCTPPASFKHHRLTVGSAHLVDVDEIDPDAAPTQRGHDRAQCFRGASGATDHLAEVIRMDAHLEDLTATKGAQVDLDLVGMVDDAANEVVERLFQHQLSEASVGVCTGSSP